MDFKIDFGNVGAPPVAVDQPLYASEDGIASSLGGDECVFEVRRTGVVHPMTTQVLQALDTCRPFLPLSEHVARVAQTLPGLNSQYDAVRRVLDSLVQRGLLISDTEFRDGLLQTGAPTLAPLRAVFIRACDRPQQLRRLLGSLAEYERESGARRRYVVLDDSRDAANSRDHASALTEFAKRSGVRTGHFDATRWRNLVERACRELPDAAAAIRFALGRDGAADRSGGGKGYNLATLLGAGARFAMLDDDFLLPLRSAPDATAGLELVAVADQPARFFGSVDAALESGTAFASDPFEQQLAWCGHTLGAVLAQDASMAPDRAALRGLEPSRLPQLRSDTRVIATCNGHRGNSGAASSDWLFLLDPESRADWCRDRETYLDNLDGARVWFGPRRARLLEQGHFTPFLVDGSQLLPPTTPWGRSEDLLFGMLSQLAHPHSAVMHSNLAVGHAQEGARNAGAARHRADTPGFNQFVNDFLGSRLREIRAEAPAARLASAAAMLRDVAAAPQSVRRDLLDEYLRFRRSDLIQRLQHAFHSTPTPPIFWQSDVRELITVNGRALAEAAAPRLGDWPATLDDRGCADRLAQDLNALADLLQHWPRVWEWARGQGEQLLA